MVYRILLGVIFLSMTIGCATTGSKSNQEQLQTRISDLERKIEEKDSEIVDLQYQVKDISSRVSSNKESFDSYNSATEYSGSTKSSQKVYTDEIIRVDASIKDIQTALKNAGVYSGKIDGKVGSGTKAAIVDFQKQHQLTADGVLGKRTWKTLKSYLK